MDDAGEHKGLALADHIADRRGVHQNFDGERAAVAIGSGDELLGNDPAQRFTHHDANLVALVGGENIEQAVERARGVAGVERAEHEVAGLRGGDGEGDRLEVAHFADHDDIGVLAERAAKSVGEGFRVSVNLALGDMATARRDDVFDRILERDDVVVAGAVDLVDERGERGALAAAHRTGHKHEAVVEFREELELIRQAELLHAADGIADDAENEVIARALADDAGAEPADPGGIGEIDIAARGELLLLRLGQKSHREIFRILWRQRYGLLPDWFENAEPAPDRLGVHAQVDVRGARFLGDGQILVHMVESGD